MTTDTIRANSSVTMRGVVRWFIRETMGIAMAGVVLFQLFGNRRDCQLVMRSFCGKTAWRMTAYVKNHGNSQ